MKILIEGISGKGAGFRREFDTPAVKVGRGDWNDLVFNDPSQKMVSRNHAEFRIEQRIVTITDLQSSFGTFVNGQKISSCELQPNDVIQFGIRGPEVRIMWEKSVAVAPDANRTVLAPDLTPGATVVVDGRTGALPLGGASAPPTPGKSQPTVVVSAEQRTGLSESAPPATAPGQPKPTVVFDAREAQIPSGASDFRSPVGKPKPTVVYNASSIGEEHSSRAAAGVPSKAPSQAPPAGPGEPKSSGSGRGVGKETMAFLINDAIRKERERQGAPESGQQAQTAIKSISKLKVLVIGAGAVLAIVLIAVVAQNIRLQWRLQEQEAKLKKTENVSADMVKQMGKTEDAIEKARREAEEATKQKLAETEKRFQDILTQKDREYRTQLEDIKKKASALEAINSKISRDRQETVAVSKQVSESAEAAVVLVYCQYTLSDQESRESHGTGFVISPDGKVLTAKQVLEPWKFDPDVVAYMKAARLTLVKRDVYVWRPNSKLQQGDAPNLAAAFSTAAGNLTIAKVASDEMEDQTYTREDTGEKIPIRIHKMNCDNNLALLQIKGASMPSIRSNAAASSADTAAGATVMLYGYPLGIEMPVAKPEMVRASLLQSGNVLRIDKQVSRGQVGAPLLIQDGSAIGMVLSEKHTIPIRTAMKIIG